LVAKGPGVEVKRSQLDTEIVNIKSRLASMRQNLPPEQIATLERQALDGLITFQLVLAKATVADKEKGMEAFKAALVKYKTDRKMTDEEFNDQQSRELRIMGATREQWEKQNIDQQILRIVLERELKISVTDADMQKYYDENPSQFEEPEMVRVSHILFMTVDPATQSELPEDKKMAKRKKAEDTRKRALAGENFTKLADELSEDTGVKENHGEYKFSRNDPFVEEFKAAAFTLSSNQVSEIVTTQFGYHILKQHEKIPSRKIPLSESSERLKDYLKQKDMQTRLPEYFEKLLKDSKVEILDEKLKAVEINKPAASAASEKPAEKK